MQTAPLCQPSLTCTRLLFTQVCYCPTLIYSTRASVHCNTAVGNMPFSLLRGALQNRLTAGLCHCKYTWEDLVFIQVGSEPTTSALQHSCWQHAIFTTQRCSAKQTDSRLVSLQIHLGRFGHFALSSAALHWCLVTAHRRKPTSKVPADEVGKDLQAWL